MKLSTLDNQQKSKDLATSKISRTNTSMVQSAILIMTLTTLIAFDKIWNLEMPLLFIEVMRWGLPPLQLLWTAKIPFLWEHLYHIGHHY